MYTRRHFRLCGPNKHSGVQNVDDFDSLVARLRAGEPDALTLCRELVASDAALVLEAARHTLMPPASWLLRRAAEADDALVEAVGALAAVLAGHSESRCALCVGGTSLEIRNDARGPGTGTRVWRASRVAARACETGWGGLRVSGRRVLELGCGTAAAGLACAALGASAVLATDVDDAGLALAARNAALNGLGGAFAVARLDLSRPDDLEPPQPAPDLLVASDLLYDFLSADALCASVARLLGHAATGAVALCVHDRAQHRTAAARRSVDGFLDAAARHGLRCVASASRADPSSDCDAGEAGELLVHLLALEKS